MKILVCQHVPHETLGNYEVFLAEQGIAFEYQEMPQEPEPRPLANYQGLIILGGPMSVDQESQYSFLRTDLFYIAESIRLGLPTLGICLGAQLIAKFLGAKVSRSSRPELGWYPVELEDPYSPLFQNFPARFPVFQWHQDNLSLPLGSLHLISSPTNIYQAFSWGDHLYGLQFHLETTPAMLQQWLRDDTTIRGWGFDPLQIAKDSERYLKETTELARTLMQNFRKLFSIDTATISY